VPLVQVPALELKQYVDVDGEHQTLAPALDRTDPSGSPGPRYGLADPRAAVRRTPRTGRRLRVLRCLPRFGLGNPGAGRWPAESAPLWATYELPAVTRRARPAAAAGDGGADFGEVLGSAASGAREVLLCELTLGGLSLASGPVRGWVRCSAGAPSADAGAAPIVQVSPRVGRPGDSGRGCATLAASDSEGNQRARPSSERPLPAKAA
jgi:hypothetical protein